MAIEVPLHHNNLQGLLEQVGVAHRREGAELAPLGETPEPTRATINLDEDDAAEGEARDDGASDTVGGDDPSPQPN